MSAAVVVLLVALGVLERVTRADVMRRLMHPVGFGRALTIHDVGTSASKGIPLGGPLADYQVSGVESESAGTAISGVLGVGVTFIVGLGLLALFQRRRVST